VITDIPHARSCPFEARAFVDDQLVAASTDAVIIETPGASPLLCFPASSVRGAPDGALLRAAPAGYRAFDPSQARVSVKLVDGETLKRFPTWGDAADLIKLLDVQPSGDRSYVSVTHRSPFDSHRGVVEGSQMLGQAIVAATRHAPGRRVVSATMMFLRAAATAEPLQLQLDELSGGRNFSTLAPHVRQKGKLCASGIMLLDAMAPDVIRHAVAAPDTTDPARSVPYDMAVTGRDVRFVDAAYTGDPEAPVGPPVIDAWVKFRDLPDDPAIHAALLAQFTGHASIASALRPHAGVGQRQAHRTLSTAINAIHIAFHAAVRADRWMLYRHHSTFAGDGMTHSECRVHDEQGALLASFSVDAMVRRFASERAPDARTAL
jgi:acyl-CoA thioesterase